jgi:integrase
VATRLAEQLGVAGEQTIKRVLGHSDGSVTAIYNRYGYVKEMRAALEAWAQDLCGVEFSEVVELATFRPAEKAAFAR